MAKGGNPHETAQFIALEAAAGATIGVPSRAQQPGNTRRIIIATPPGASVEEMRTNPYNQVFLQRLASLGFVEGQNLIVDRYSAEGHRGAYRELADAMVKSQPDATSPPRRR